MWSGRWTGRFLRDGSSLTGPDFLYQLHRSIEVIQERAQVCIDLLERLVFCIGVIAVIQQRRVNELSSIVTVHSQQGKRQLAADVYGLLLDPPVSAIQQCTKFRPPREDVSGRQRHTVLP